MAINKESNGYTFGFAIVLVVVVGGVLALVAMFAKPYQDKNKEVKKKMDILKAMLDEKEAEKVTRKTAEAMFDEYVSLENAVVLDMNGEVQEGIDPFNVDIKKQYRDKTLKPEDMRYPLYVSEDESGKRSYIIPIVGKGLWGPIWGNICLGDDMRTIKGATFDHKTETPGLGAEIKQQFFIKGWIGEQITDDEGNFQEFEVVKDNSGSKEPFKVDGITGGTITSKGVEEMVNRCLKPYVKYFNTLK